MKSAPDPWQPHNGGSRPRTGERPILVRLRCRTRADVEMHQHPELAKWWKRWTHDGGAGDIMEWRYP